MAEIKQFLRPDGLWTQQGENSHRPLISLNLKRYINPGKSKITEWITPVRDTAGNIEAICVGSSMFQLRKQERMWTSCSALAKWSPVFQVNLHNTGSKTTHISFKYTSLWNAYWTRKKGWPHRNHIYLTSGRLFYCFLFFYVVFTPARNTGSSVCFQCCTVLHVEPGSLHMERKTPRCDNRWQIQRDLDMEEAGICP